MSHNDYPLCSTVHNMRSPSASRGRQPRVNHLHDFAQIAAHHSKLPLFLYLLSFGNAPTNDASSWKPRISHSYTLYAVGTIAAVLAGLTHAAWGLVYGYWTRGMTSGLDDGQLLHRGQQAGWLMAIIGLWSLVLTCVYMMCCEFKTLLYNEG